MEGVAFNPIRPIATTGGVVLHALKSGDSRLRKFGEAYFTTIDPGHTKGWTRHNRMTLNLFVCGGAVRFVVYDDRAGSATSGQFEVHVLDREDNYGCLTVAPGLWLAFQGKPGGTVLNLADLEHDPAEADKRDLHAIEFDW